MILICKDDNTKNAEVSTARNRGIQETSGEYIYFSILMIILRKKLKELKENCISKERKEVRK